MYHFSDNRFMNALLNFCAVALIAMIAWPLLDLVWCAVFQETFAYSFGSHIFPPLVFALIITMVPVLSNRKKQK